MVEVAGRGGLGDKCRRTWQAGHHRPARWRPHHKSTPLMHHSMGVGVLRVPGAGGLHALTCNRQDHPICRVGLTSFGTPWVWCHLPWWCPLCPAAQRVPTGFGK